MQTEIRALQPGTIVHQRYQIEKLLGAGGFGITYQALDRREGCSVALKEYMPVDIAARNPGTMGIYPTAGQQESYEKFRTRFLEEARVIFQFRNHPDIISVKHLFYENNTAYYVMEYMEGDDLSKLIKAGKTMEWNWICQTIDPIVNALERVHQAGMIHCDISPDNIFLQNNGNVKLIDFGAAKHIMKGQSSVIILKKGYAPPEQFASNGRLGVWTDIYALAVTIYQLYTGKMPPVSTERLTEDNIVWPSGMGKKIPSSKWEEALKKALTLRIDERYHSVREFWNDLTCDRVLFSQQKQKEKLFLEGVRGAFIGQRIYLSGSLHIGTDALRCQVQYPQGSPGISRVHMRIQEMEDEVIAIDMGSTYGTYLNGERMKPGLVYPLMPGMVIGLGDRQMFRVEKAKKRL